MTEQITLQVLDRVMRHAAHAASMGKREVKEVPESWLERAVAEMPVEELPDDEVLAATRLQLSTQQETLLSELLTRNREGSLDAESRRKLEQLMRKYEHGLLRKSQALRVAVERGLREPMEP